MTQCSTVKERKGYEVRGLDVISVPTFTFHILAMQIKSHATPPWLRDFGERQAEIAPLELLRGEQTSLDIDDDMILASTRCHHHQEPIVTNSYIIHLARASWTGINMCVCMWMRTCAFICFWDGKNVEKFFLCLSQSSLAWCISKRVRCAFSGDLWGCVAE